MTSGLIRTLFLAIVLSGSCIGMANAGTDNGKGNGGMNNGKGNGHESAPELDPSTLGSGLLLLAGAILVLPGGRHKRQ